MAASPTNHPTPFHSSDLPPQEYLNPPSASRIRSGSRFTATIPPYDQQSFVTDIPQTWLSQPQSPRLPTPATSTTSSFSNQDSDFVLFPSPATTTRAAQTTRRNTDCVPATSRTALNPPRLSQTYHGQQNYQRRRNSTHQSLSSVSPNQNLRVSGIIQGTGSLSSSPSIQQFNSSPGQQQQRFYANSAPSSTIGLHQQSLRRRPPVPLFANSTGNIQQQNIPTMALSHSFEDVSPDSMFDFNNDNNSFPSAPGSSDGLLDGSLDFGAHFESINDPAPPQTPNLLTVSPKDLMVDSMSAPPSGAFTDLTTPGTSLYDSPYVANSTETSPLFAEDSFTDDPDQWPSLFDPIEEDTNKGPVSHFAGVSPSPTCVAPKMSRNGSSPGQSAHHGRHASTSGVGSKRRDKPLPAITVDDPNDTVAVKRARNTMAARKSREKRVERTEQLVNQVTQLEAEVQHWKEIAISMGHVE